MGTASRKIGVLILAVTLFAGCTMDPARNRVNVVQPATTVIPSGTGDPRAAAAVSTYRAFLRTADNAFRHPVMAVNSHYPEASNFAKYSVDPIQAQYEAFISALVQAHHAYRGTPPKSTVTVTSIDLGAEPYPLITLADCQTEKDTWRAYNTRTNAVNPQLTPGVAAPYGITVNVAYVQMRWQVQTIKPDPAGTCAG
jgi:hypothetical protein